MLISSVLVLVVLIALFLNFNTDFSPLKKYKENKLSYKLHNDRAKIFLTAKEFISLHYLAPDVLTYQKKIVLSYFYDEIGNYYSFSYKKDDTTIPVGISSYNDYKKVLAYIAEEEAKEKQDEAFKLKTELIKSVRESLGK